MPLAGIAPDEDAAAWQSPGLNQTPFDLHVLDFEEVLRRELCQNVHAELRGKIVAGADGHLSHTGPDGHQSGIVEFDFLRHENACLAGE
jgi:hypothetical protein